MYRCGEAETGSDRHMWTVGVCASSGGDGGNAAEDSGDTWQSRFIKILPTLLPPTLSQSHSLPPPPAPTEVDQLMIRPPAPNGAGLPAMKRRVQNCNGYGKVGVALLDSQSWNQLCRKLEILFIKRLLSEDCSRCADLCVEEENFRPQFPARDRKNDVRDEKRINKIHRVLIYDVCCHICSSSLRHTRSLLKSFSITSMLEMCLRAMHSSPPRDFMRKMVYYIQYHQKGTAASFCKKKKSNISVHCNTDNITVFL
ncbi:hypothetical protein IRJ41_004421 [Triplophysa rosa]|uniref:Uncharacterized protein n=1 Tax=Triplophysa rosa TaxID=992332 RepID=A0A9W7TDF4_TRIRA|nr:hypothetical protein IRJ41_004421 [Triplophysa rosa]